MRVGNRCRHRKKKERKNRGSAVSSHTIVSHTHTHKVCTEEYCGGRQRGVGEIRSESCDRKDEKEGRCFFQTQLHLLRRCEGLASEQNKGERKGEGGRERAAGVFNENDPRKKKKRQSEYERQQLHEKDVNCL